MKFFFSNYEIFLKKKLLFPGASGGRGGSDLHARAVLEPVAAVRGAARALQLAGQAPGAHVLPATPGVCGGYLLALPGEFLEFNLFDASLLYPL